MTLNAVGIDVSKGKSMVTIMRPFGEVVASPFEITHTSLDFEELTELIKSLKGETKVVMECTGWYHYPVANALHKAGLFVSTVHAKLIHDYSNNTIRKVKTDKADSIKIANYGLSNWLELKQYLPEEDIRIMLKTFSRQYSKYQDLKTMLKNNFIALTDRTFPGVNELLTSTPRKKDGHEKWLDFALSFWHCECVCTLTPKTFANRYQKWCKKEGYRFSQDKSDEIYASACGHFSVMPKNEKSKLLVTQAIGQINAVSENIAIIAREMKLLAETLPEYPLVSQLYGVGEILGPQLIAEIGDVFRFRNKGSLVAFAGIDAPPYESGKFVASSRSISKKGSAHLRKTLFQVAQIYLQHSPVNEPVYQFIDRKRSEGKHFYNYMTAASAKFLRIYYARTKEYLINLSA